jgi:ferredoxin
MASRNKLDDHPTVVQVRQRDRAADRLAEPLDASWLRELCLDAGADDVGFVEIGRPEVADQRADLEAALPGVRTLISFVSRMNRENIRTPARSVANLEFHHSGDRTNEVGRQVVAELEAMGVRAINPAMGFPMEMDKFPRKTWVVGHKPVAVAAGLGKMGIHRNVIHPKFGNFVLLGTVLIDAEVSDRSRALEFNPCVECKLCVTACPTGAIAADGHFDFSACYTHNYREFMGGFGDWVEQVADSRNAADYRSRVGDAETASMWQGLSFGANYKAANCMSVCPAGEDVLGPWLDDRKAHLTDVVRPLLDKEETIYVVPGSDAEQYVARRFPHKRTKRVGQSLRASSIEGLVEGLPLIFQREQARGLSATYHFTFTGAESRQITVTIRDRELDIAEGLHGEPDLGITADSRTWLRFLTTQSVLPWALLSGRIKMHGPPRLLRAFGRCFPSQSVRKQRTVEPSPQQGRAITGAPRAAVERDLVLERKETVADGVVLLTLRDPDGRPLPEWQPGAHVDLMLRADLVRQYSLCGDPADRSRLQVAVLREPESRGGSSYVHDVLSEGESVRIRGPRNNFPLVQAKRYLFIAGGIGITPILPMVAAVDARGADWRLVYGGRT